MQKAVIVFALLLLPSLASAVGFANAPLFLSKSSVIEGDTVLIHAVVTNEAASAFAGTMQFSEGSTAIGSVPVSLSAGEASAISVSWKPLGGSRTVVAELKKGAEMVEKQSATFVIAQKPKPVSAPAAPPGQTAAAVESSAKIQEGIAGVSPQAASAVAPVFTLIDGGRATLSNTIDGQIVVAKKNLGPREGEVLSAETVTQAKADPMGTVWFILWTLYLYLLTLLNFIIGSAGIFYPVLAFLILYFLWRLIRRFRRPAY